MSKMDILGKVGFVMIITGVVITLLGFVTIGVGGIAVLLTLLGKG